MKKFILMFFLLHIFSYADYLISNSEIVLFYDKTYNNIQYIRGDVFNNIALSQIDCQLIVDKKEVISLNNYLTNISVLQNTNIMQLLYDINGDKLTISIIPSMIEKEKLYFIIDFLPPFMKNKNIDFSIRLVPQYDNKFVQFDKSTGSYHYDNFYFRSENYYGDLYIARNSKLEEFTLEKVVDRDKKYQDDNMYYIIDNVNVNTKPIFTIKFYHEFSPKIITDSTTIFAQEFEYWNKLDNSIDFDRSDKITQGQIKNLDIITSRAVIPDQISFNKSKENLDNKIELYYIKSTLDPSFDPMKFLEDINVRKKDSEAVVYYTMLFKYLNNTGNFLDPQLFEKKVSLEVLSLLDYLEESDGEIVNVRDNIRNYCWYFRMIKNIKNRQEFIKDKEFIEDKEKYLYEYVTKYYVLPDGLKTRRDDKKAYYKNIRYMDFMPKEYQVSILNKDLKKYYNSSYGLLIVPEDDGKIDLEYNLTFIIKLYENGDYTLADKMLAKVEELIAQNNEFLIPQVYVNKNNPVGIYGNMLSLYFTAAKYKERYKNGN